MKPPQLILFDFDGTLTTRDTMIEFVRFVRGNGRLWWGYLWLMPSLLAYKAGFLANDRAKVRFLRHHLGGLQQDFLEKKAAEFAATVVPRLLRPAGMNALQRHISQGDRVVLVSASLDIWLTDWARSTGIELICTEGAWRKGRFIGDLATPNCYGSEKVRRIQDLLDPKEYARVVAYGDSKGDREMLAFADEAHFQPFR